MDIKIVDGYDYPEEVRALFSEYTDMLIANDAEFKKNILIFKTMTKKPLT